MPRPQNKPATNVLRDYVRECIRTFLDPDGKVGEHFTIGFFDVDRDVMKSLADELFMEGEKERTINDYYILWTNGEATGEQMLAVYLIDNCDTPEDLKKHTIKIRSMEYREFLESEYWQVIRTLILDRHGWRCAICGSNQHLQVHHRDYTNHGQEHLHPEDLTALCDSCHAKYHNKLPRFPGSRYAIK